MLLCAQDPPKEHTDYIESVIDIGQVIAEAFDSITSNALLLAYRRAYAPHTGILVYTRGDSGYECDLTGVYSIEFRELPNEFLPKKK